MAGWAGVRCASLALATVWIVVTNSASADILILDSNVPRIKRGAKLGDSERLRIPAGKSVMIMRPSGETQEIAGPYDHLVRDIAGGETISDTFRAMRLQLQREAPGAAVGGTRAVPR